MLKSRKRAVILKSQQANKAQENSTSPILQSCSPMRKPEKVLSREKIYSALMVVFRVIVTVSIPTLSKFVIQTKGKANAAKIVARTSWLMRQRKAGLLITSKASRSEKRKYRLSIIQANPSSMSLIR
jgi:hypothetical protein